MVQLIGERHNVVCISQYFEAYREELPGLWFHEYEGLEKVRVDYPIPGSGRYIVSPAQPQPGQKPASESGCFASNPEYFKHSGKISVDNLLSN